jgi:hypothetical protein
MMGLTLLLSGLTVSSGLAGAPQSRKKRSAGDAPSC